MKLMECVPNFSEGRDQNILNSIAEAIKNVNRVSLLDIDPGADTNRTVFTMVGDPEAIVEAAFQAIKRASELIDMSKHTGAHPRFGATDVCPFIPVSDMTMEECVDYSKKLGKRVGEELGIPVYLYGYSASKPEWSNLANIRQGEYEALPLKMQDPEWKPDFGPHSFNSHAGATAIGAREFLIAYNINLNTRDKNKANDIALLIREKGSYLRDDNGKIVKDKNGEKMKKPGLFTECRAIGWFIDQYDRAQISMNLTNYKVTAPHIVLDKVREIAHEMGLHVTGSELVGLIPKAALLEAGKYYLKKSGASTGINERKILETAVQSMGLAELCEFDLDKKIIEYCIANQNNLVNMKINEFADELASDSPAPGGGSVAALSVSLSGALSAMVSNLTFGKKGYETVWEKSVEFAERGQAIKLEALQAIDDDTFAFNEMMAAMRLPKKTDEEKRARDEAMEKATQNAILVPLETLKIAHKAVLLAAEVAEVGNKNALSDAGVAAIMANAAAKSAYLNVKINMSGISDAKFKEDVLNQSDILIDAVNKAALEVENKIKATL
ncbi:MAG: glutamate formimidoyltransferase [Candidatus Cloacimonetes bacterium]|nr:glutamate formimidoyltransferase [Candidatus Cloacimonadota bacterium]